MNGIPVGAAMLTDLPILGDLNLIVTGYIEPNRPRLSRQLARRLGLQMIDVERRVEDHFGESRQNIRSRYGERRLKAVEAQIMDEVILHRGVLIRISGSALLNSGYLSTLQRSGTIICLVASLDSILRQIHLTLGARYHNPTERALALGELQREWKIRGLDGVVEFDATYISDAVLTGRIADFWRNLALRRG